jgi:hypothetical protein
MGKQFLAFFLACSTIPVILGVFDSLIPNSNLSRPIEVTIRSNGDTHDIVTAIEALHRQDIDIHTMKNFTFSGVFWFLEIPRMAVGLTLLTGLVLVFFKLYCRLLHIPPAI